jgi:hypothetical protein
LSSSAPNPADRPDNADVRDTGRGIRRPPLLGDPPINRGNVGSVFGEIIILVVGVRLANWLIDVALQLAWAVVALAIVAACALLLWWQKPAAEQARQVQAAHSQAEFERELAAPHLAREAQMQAEQARERATPAYVVNARHRYQEASAAALQAMQLQHDFQGTDIEMRAIATHARAAMIEANDALLALKAAERLWRQQKQHP